MDGELRGNEERGESAGLRPLLPGPTSKPRRNPWGSAGINLV
jgi:hypothetical protein